MPSLEMMRGPALRAIAPDDGEALRHLEREQRARVATICEQRIWSWLGGEFARFDHLWSLYSVFVFMAMTCLTVLVAGFTQGPVLWVVAALTALSILPYWFVFLPTYSRTLRFYRAGELRPAFVLAVAPELEDPDEEDGHAAHVLVGPAIGDPARLQAQAALGARITSALAGGEGLGTDAAGFVARLREQVEAGCADGHRQAVPAALAADCEVAHVRLWPRLLPEGHLTSRLLFVFLAPDEPGPGSTTVVQSLVWGEGADALCAAFPREVAR